MTDDSTPNGQHDAHVQVLTAEVRTLMVGSRQVTLSVYSQLDEVGPRDIEPFGRVEPRSAEEGYLHVVGRRAGDGDLVRARAPASSAAIKTWLAKFDAAIRQADPATSEARDEAREAERKAKGCLTGWPSAANEERWATRHEVLAETAQTEGERKVHLQQAAANRRKIDGYREKSEAERQRAGRLLERAAQWNDAACELRVALASAQDEYETRARQWGALPKIVLAGLR